MRAEIDIEGVRMLVEMPDTLPPAEADGTTNVDFTVIEVISPPEARAAWLKEFPQGSRP